MAFRLLPQFFDAAEICPHTTFDALLAVPAVERQRYRLFHGHFYNHLRHFVSGPLSVLTLLRHPFERAISQYRYILSSPTHPLHQAVAAEPDFAAYFRNRRLFAPNSLTLGLGSELQPDVVLRRAIWRGLNPHAIDDLFDEETFYTAARQCHVEAAKAMLDRCFLVGLQEEMNKTAALVHHHFGQTFSGNVEIVNESRSGPLHRDDLSDHVLADLAAYHERDLDVYAYGKALFEQQWAAASGTPSASCAAPAIVTTKPAPAPRRLHYMTLPWCDDVDFADRLLSCYYRPSEICPAWNYRGLLSLPPTALTEYSAFHGYFHNHLRRFVAGSIDIATLLRHPFKRAIAQFHAIRSDPRHPQYRAVAAEPDFLAYLRNRRLFMPNSLTLALGSVFDPDTVRRRGAWRDLPPDSVDDLFDEETFSTAARAYHAEAAKAVLDRCVMVGLHEDMAQTAAMMHRLLGRADRAAALHEAEAAAPGRIELPDDVLAELTALHKYDLDVYAHGKSIFERLCASAGEPSPAAPVVLRPMRPASPPTRLYYMNLPWGGDVDLASQVLHGCSRSSAVCPAWNYDGLFALPAEALGEYSCFHGHFFWPLADFVGKPLAPITFLTDPVERAAQQHREILADPEHEHHALMRGKAGLGDFLRDPVAFTPNVLTLSLAGRFSRRDMTKLAAEARSRGTSINQLLGEHITLHPATPRDLARAKCRLEQCAFIGFMDSFDLSLAALGHLLDWPTIGQSITPDFRRHAARRADVSAADRSLVAALNPFDMQLYEFARALPSRRSLRQNNPFRRLQDRLLSR